MDKLSCHCMQEDSNDIVIKSMTTDGPTNGAIAQMTLQMPYQGS